MRQATESGLVRVALEFLALKGVFAWRNNTGGFGGEYEGKKRFVRFGKPGAPDIMGILPSGRFIGVECKSAKGKQSPAQHAWQFNCEAQGGLYILVRNLDDLADALKNHGY